MTDLRNVNLRVRDVRRLVSYKYSLIRWDRGSEEESEWQFASLESEDKKEQLTLLLESKEILSSCEALLVESSWSKLRRITWGDILSSPEHYFGKSDFQLYCIDLVWVLEYKSLQVFRFGRISPN